MINKLRIQIRDWLRGYSDGDIQRRKAAGDFSPKVIFECTLSILRAADTITDTEYKRCMAVMGGILGNYSANETISWLRDLIAAQDKMGKSKQ